MLRDRYRFIHVVIDLIVIYFIGYWMLGFIEKSKFK